MTVPRALTIAGSDPSGGAGVAADLAVFAAFRCHGMAVLAGLTVQDSRRVHWTGPIDADLVVRQTEALLADCPPAAAKTGMVASADAVRALATLWSRHAGIALVVDPVSRAGDGSRLASEDAERATNALLVPRAALVTPNAVEAAAMTGLTVTDVAGSVAAARRLVEMGAGAALVKGGHVSGEIVRDVLVERGRPEPVVFERGRVPAARRIHGTGCALSAAVAALLARGRPLEDAVDVAGRFVHAAIRGAHAIGGGALVLDFSARVPGMP